MRLDDLKNLPVFDEFTDGIIRELAEIQAGGPWKQLVYVVGISKNKDGKNYLETKRLRHQNNPRGEAQTGLHNIEYLTSYECLKKLK